MHNEEKVLVNVTPNETRVAWVENGVLQEVWVERANKRGLVGNIYMGKVDRVLPGMQAAFINIGLERAAFLHVSDICHKAIGHEDEECDDIAKLLHLGQKIMVQVLKDPLGAKGARITMQVTIPSRMLVFMPVEKALGVSQKIDAAEERDRLRDMVKTIPEYSSSEGGVIVRTVADGVDFHEMRADMIYLQRLWSGVQERARLARKPTVIYEDLPLYLRIMRDIPLDRIEKIRVDSTETLAKMTEFVEMYVM